MPKSPAKIAIICLILTNVIWGASAPIFKWSLTDISPMALGFLRFLLASLILLPFVIHKIKIKKHDVLKLFFLSFLGFGLNIGLILIGLKLSPSINAPIIGSSAPVFLLLGSMLFLREKVRSKTIIGTFISLLGVIIIVIKPIFSEGFDTKLLGNVLFILSTLAFIAYTLLLKRFRLPYPSLTVTFWLFVFAAINFFLFLPLDRVSYSALFSFDLKGLIGVLFGGIFTSTIAYCCFNYAVAKIDTNEVGVFLYIDPIIAALIALPLLGEQITLTYLLGSALVFLGIFIAEKRLHYHPIHKLRRS